MPLYGAFFVSDVSFEPGQVINSFYSGPKYCTAPQGVSTGLPAGGGFIRWLVHAPINNAIAVSMAVLIQS